MRTLFDLRRDGALSELRLVRNEVKSQVTFPVGQNLGVILIHIVFLCERITLRDRSVYKPSHSFLFKYASSISPEIKFFVLRKGAFLIYLLSSRQISKSEEEKHTMDMIQNRSLKLRVALNRRVAGLQPISMRKQTGVMLHRLQKHQNEAQLSNLRRNNFDAFLSYL